MSDGTGAMSDVEQTGGGAERTGATAGVPGDVTIVETTDVATVQALGIAAGLEDGARDDERLSAAWLARDRAGRAVGAVALERSCGLDVVNWLSVDEAWRGHGVGARLLRALEGHARARGLTRLWATARAPGFFLANGYREVPDGPEAGLLLGDCLTCRQYGHDCEPRAMVKDLGLTGGAARQPHVEAARTDTHGMA